MTDLHESDLAAKVVAYLEAQHWDIYQEVNFGSGGAIADIVAVRAGYLWIIECKTSLTFTVLEQANHWRSHYRSVAIPLTRNTSGRGTAYHIANKFLKLGILEVGNDDRYGDFVKEIFEPPLMREYHKHAKWMISELKPKHKTMLAAGSKGGGYWTPYKATMESVRRYIRLHPGCSLKEIVDGINNYHYANRDSAMGCIRKALTEWETDWCQIEKIDGKTVYFVKSPA